jgi:hypothetical protein
LAISWIHSKTDDDDAVGEGEKKAENEQVSHQALSSSSCMGLCGSLHGDHAVGYHHQLNAQIYSKTEMMVLFAKAKKAENEQILHPACSFSHGVFSLESALNHHI